MPAYYVGEHIVSNFAVFDEYLSKVVPMIERFGGRYLTKAGSHEILEGDWKPNRVVIIEFPDIASIKNWYRAPEYQPLIALRRSVRSFVAKATLVPTRNILLYFGRDGVSPRKVRS